ncbi:hypothetical protein ACFWBV_24240 [Streptomyces sp. NPDC060030]|uniref:hypothetical protein n=1 Tax=Streptomyces sp. NPDC060030 TaxID=3347042 RepID=UPI0036C32541
METLYRLSYWGLSPCGNEIKHTPDEGVFKTILTGHLPLAPQGLLQAAHRQARQESAAAEAG